MEPRALRAGFNHNILLYPCLEKSGLIIEEARPDSQRKDITETTGVLSTRMLGWDKDNLVSTEIRKHWAPSEVARPKSHTNLIFEKLNSLTASTLGLGPNKSGSCPTEIKWDWAPSIDEFKSMASQNTIGNTEAERSILEDSLNFPKHKGTHTVKSPAVGSRQEELKAIKKAIQSVKILSKLQEAIYAPKYIHLIPLDKKDEADAAAQKMFLNYISKYSEFGITEQNAVIWSKNGMPGCVSNKTIVYDLENQLNTWHAEVIVEARHGNFNEEFNHYLPPHVVAYHELMHLEELEPRCKDGPTQNGDELLATIKTFILLDIVYKEIHGLPLESTVDYGKHIEIGCGKISLGAFANFYRQQEAKHGTLCAGLLSKESISFLEGQKT